MRLKISDIRVEDSRKIAHWKSDPILSRQLISNFKETSVCDAIGWIETNSIDKNQCLQGIYLTKDGLCGLVGIVRLMYIDYESSTAELGIYIGDQSNQGKGIGGDALDLMLRKAFVELELKKIYLKVVSFNRRAISLYLKRDFQIEGTLREHYYFNGSFYDVICMAKFGTDFV